MIERLCTIKTCLVRTNDHTLSTPKTKWKYINRMHIYNPADGTSLGYSPEVDGPATLPVLQSPILSRSICISHTRYFLCDHY